MSIQEIIFSVETLQSYLVLIRTAVMGQTVAETGIIGPKCWEDIFSDMGDRVYDIIEALQSIKQDN